MSTDQHGLADELEQYRAAADGHFVYLPHPEDIVDSLGIRCDIDHPVGFLWDTEWRARESARRNRDQFGHETHGPFRVDERFLVLLDLASPGSRNLP